MHVLGQHSCFIQACLLGPLHGGSVLLHARVITPVPHADEHFDHGPHTPTGFGVVVAHGRALHGACDGPAHHLPSPSRSIQVRVCVFKAVDPHGHFPYALYVLASGRVNEQRAKETK